MSPDPPVYQQPVFVVGSPRSGTSILSWSLGQHPNLLGLEESNWMAPFAIDVAVAFRRGSARGERSQFSSMGMQRDKFMQDIGACINASILGHRRAFEVRRAQLAKPAGPEDHVAFKIARNRSDPKLRFVNGTPEYSLGIGGLRKLFPGARFIHLVRDCDLVVTSMLHFERVAGTILIETEEQGYTRWLGCVRACVAAENAYGPDTVCRIFHEDLVAEPETLLHRILEFLGEPFAPACLEPLAKRINSSNIAKGEERRAPAADPSLISEARQLWKTLREIPQPKAPLWEATASLEDQFERRVEYIHDLDAHYTRAQQVHRNLQREFAERTEWALRLNNEVAERNRQILELKKKLAERRDESST